MSVPMQDGRISHNVLGVAEVSGRAKREPGRNNRYVMRCKVVEPDRRAANLSERRCGTRPYFSCPARFRTREKMRATPECFPRAARTEHRSEGKAAAQERSGHPRVIRSSGLFPASGHGRPRAVPFPFHPENRTRSHSFRTDRDRFLPFRCQKPYAVPFSTSPTNPKELRGSLAYVSPLPSFSETPSLQ